MLNILLLHDYVIVNSKDRKFTFCMIGKIMSVSCWKRFSFMVFSTSAVHRRATILYLRFSLRHSLSIASRTSSILGWLGTLLRSSGLKTAQQKERIVHNFLLSSSQHKPSLAVMAKVRRLPSLSTNPTSMNRFSPPFELSPH